MSVLSQEAEFFLLFITAQKCVPKYKNHRWNFARLLDFACVSIFSGMLAANAHKKIFRTSSLTFFVPSIIISNNVKCIENKRPLFLSPLFFCDFWPLFGMNGKNTKHLKTTGTQASLKTVIKKRKKAVAEWKQVSWERTQK